jgi:hypothetical protein
MILVLGKKNVNISPLKMKNTLVARVGHGTRISHGEFGIDVMTSNRMRSM